MGVIEKMSDLKVYETYLTKSLIFVWISIFLGSMLLPSCKANDLQEPQQNLSDFSFLEYGLSYTEIIHRVGSPDEEINDIVKPVAIYNLIDDKQLRMQFSDETKENLIFIGLEGEITLPIKPCALKKTNDHLTLSDFCFLEYGMSYNDVMKIVGWADLEIGNITPLAIYELEDGRSLRLVFNDISNENLILVKIWEEVTLPME